MLMCDITSVFHLYTVHVQDFLIKKKMVEVVILVDHWKKYFN